jgi:hypothetical protein
MPTNSSDGQRVLVMVPAVREAAELDRLPAGIGAAEDAGAGDAPDDPVRRYYRGLTHWVRALPHPIARLRLYHEGMPVCGKELLIARQLADQGSASHQMLLDLLDSGAMLAGSESTSLLMADYQDQLHTAEHADTPSVAALTRECDARRADARDQKLAARIDQTLRCGEWGLLLLALGRDISKHLPADITVHHPFGLGVSPLAA